MESQQNNQPKKKQKLPKLTPKQRVFVTEYVRTGNGAEAARRAYKIESENTADVAKSIATENLTKPSVIAAIDITQNTLKDALIKVGVTPEFMAKNVRELLDAGSFVYKGKQIVGFEPDFNAKDKGLKHSTNIYGLLDLEKPKPVTTYNFFFNADLRKKVQQVETDIKQALSNVAET